MKPGLAGGVVSGRKGKKVVPGEGSIDAQIMFISEALGVNEDIRGRPFVGAAGKLLDKLINDVLRLEKGEVYITNVVKCSFSWRQTSRSPLNLSPLCT